MIEREDRKFRGLGEAKRSAGLGVISFYAELQKHYTFQTIGYSLALGPDTENIICVLQ